MPLQPGPPAHECHNGRRRQLLRGLGVLPLPWLAACGAGNSADAAAAETAPTGGSTRQEETIQPPQAAPDFRRRLHSPTLILVLNGRHFIVDCWNHRIIHSPRLDAPLLHWQALDEDIAGPHSIASDGTLLVAEDTGRHGLKVYRETAPGRFEQLQYLPDVGVRPHRTRFDAASRQFVVIGSDDQSLHTFAVRNGRLEPTLATRLPSLQGQYCRSITLHRGQLHCVTNDAIVVQPFDGRRLSTQARRLPLPETLHGGNDLFFLDEEGGLFTATPGRACWFARLDDLSRGRVVDLSWAFRGTPYYISRFGGRLWIPEVEVRHVREHSGIGSFHPASAPHLARDLSLFEYGPADATALTRKAVLPT